MIVAKDVFVAAGQPWGGVDPLVAIEHITISLKIASQHHVQIKQVKVLEMYGAAVTLQHE